jgi:hypothetical protein
MSMDAWLAVEFDTFHKKINDLALLQRPSVLPGGSRSNLHRIFLRRRRRCARFLHLLGPLAI